MYDRNCRAPPLCAGRSLGSPQRVHCYPEQRSLNACSFNFTQARRPRGSCRRQERTHDPPAELTDAVSSPHLPARVDGQRYRVRHHIDLGAASPRGLGHVPCADHPGTFRRDPNTFCGQHAFTGNVSASSDRQAIFEALIVQRVQCTKFARTSC